MAKGRGAYRVWVTVLVLSLLLGNGFVWNRVYAATAAITNIPAWTGSHYSGTVTGDVYIDKAVSYSGTSSLKLTNATPKAPNVFIAVMQHVAVKPNTTYQVSMRVKGIDAARINAMRDPAWTLRKAMPAGTYDWTQIEFTITTGANMSSFPFTVVSEDVTTAFWMDDVSMTEAGGTVNLLQNSGFETLPVLAPVVSDPPAGQVDLGTRVALAVQTVGAAVYYTTDNSDPATSATRLQYGQPIAVDRPLTLKAYAVKAGYDDSPVSSFAYGIRGGADGETVTGQDLFYGSLGAGKFVPVFYADSITVDGQLNDWAGYAYADLPGDPAVQVQMPGWGGESDLSGRAYFAHDSEQLYVAFQVTDNIHQAVGGDAMWSGDGVQFASGTDGVYGPEYGFAHVDGQSQVWVWNKGDATLPKEAVTLKTSRTENVTVYEAAIPWGALHSYTPGKSMPFNLVFNDNDGSGRKGYVEWTPGIGKSKDSKPFASLNFMPQDRSWGVWMDRDYGSPGEDRITAERNRPAAFSLYAANHGDTARQYRLQIPQIGITDQLVTVPAHSVWRKQFVHAFTDLGVQTVTAVMTDQETSEARSAEWKLTILPGSADLIQRLDQVAAGLPALKALLATAQAQDIPVSYETVDVTVIERFIGYGKADVANGRLDRAQYVADQLEAMAGHTEERLNAYLAGTGNPLAAPVFVTGPVDTDGYSFRADMLDPVTGETENRPVFFTGYGAFAQVRSDIPHFSKFGTNIVQIETGPNRVILTPDSIAGWSRWNSGNADVTYRYDTAGVQEGNKAVQVGNRSPKAPNTFGTLWQTIPVKPDTTYTFSGWVKGVNVQNAWFGTYDARTAIPNGTYGWQQITGTYKTRSTETSMDFRILTENVTDSLLLDAFRVTEGANGTNLLAYPGFEDDSTVKPDYLISAGTVRNDIQKVLEQAEDHNQQVSLLLSPHYFPAFLLEKYPEMRSGANSALPVNITNVRVKEVLEDYLRTVIPLVKDYRSLHDIVLSNEPVYTTYKDPAFLPLWRQYLAEVHHDVGQLNGAYGTAYTSFEQVPLPERVEGTPLFYDWMHFNDDLFSGWHEWMAELIHGMAPDIPLSAKFMGGMLMKSQKSVLAWGVDPEQFAGFTQLNGLDSWNFLSDTTNTITEKLKIYDLLGSYREAPVFNSEDHIIVDRDSLYSPEQAAHMRTDLWQGAIHGRSASTIWVWERTYDAASDFEGSVLHRPDVVSAVGRTNLDLNRLGQEVKAFQDAPVDTAILYSRTSALYRPAHLDAVDRAYQALSHYGQKAGFISESQVVQGNLGAYKLLVIPDAENVAPDILPAVQTFMEQGGRVVLLGADSLARDAYNRVIAPEDRAYIADHAVIIPITGTAEAMAAPAENALRDLLAPVLQELGLAELELVDAATGNRVEGVEWRTAAYGGKLLVNVANYTWEPKQVVLKRNGEAVTPIRELISSGSIAADSLTLAPYAPLLLEFPAVAVKQQAELVYTGSMEADLQSTADTWLAAQIIAQQPGAGGTLAGLPLRFRLDRLQPDGSAVPVQQEALQQAVITDSAGIAGLPLQLPAGLYRVTVQLENNASYNAGEAVADVAVYNSASGSAAVAGFLEVAEGEAPEIFLTGWFAYDQTGTPTGTLRIFVEPQGLYLTVRRMDWFIWADGQAAVQGTGEYNGTSYTVRCMFTGAEGLDQPDGTVSLQLWKTDGTPEAPEIQALNAKLRGYAVIL
ncbi:MAG: hypothetical protein K0R57_4421 [Paenibacillaceae bacterium]|nr:hypothetical protein [Paenibacillaceae bacterium]